jgi:RNA polymerase sigma-70 factor (ECF subfamily)
MDDRDSLLVERAQAGDRAAFDELVHRHRPGLVRFAALLINDADEAESLAQEALTRAYTQLAEFKRELPFLPWLRGITLNLCRNHLRERTRHARPISPEQLAEVPAAAGQRQGVLSGILRQEAGEQTREAIAQLPAALREAFVLHFIEGMDYESMGRITGLAAGTLRVRAHRARTLLRSHLGSVVDTWLRGEGRVDMADPEP